MNSAIYGLSRAVWAAAVLACGISPDLRAEPLLRSGDRLVFMGDSITEQRLYTRYGIPSYDLHALMLDVLNRGKADQSGFTLMPDAYHPAPPGAMVMAYGLIRALGYSNAASSCIVHAAEKTVQAERCVVTDLSVSDTRLKFNRKDASLPAYIDPRVTAALKYVPFESELNAYRFQATGLKPGPWKISVAGVEVGVFSEKELAAGVDLAGKPGPWKTLGERIDALAVRQETLDIFNWRKVTNSSLPAPPEVAPEYQALLEKVKTAIIALERERQQLMSERTWLWELNLTSQ